MSGKVSKQVGQSLRGFRLRQGLSIHKLAVKAEVSASHLSSVERGQQSPTIDFLEQLCEHLDVAVAEVLPTNRADDSTVPGVCRFRDACPIVQTAKTSLARIQEEAGRTLEQVTKLRAEVALERSTRRGGGGTSRSPALPAAPQSRP